jgi:hypothetical protein
MKTASSRGLPAKENKGFGTDAAATVSGCMCEAFAKRSLPERPDMDPPKM